MTELERQLTAALERLSAQYALEQQRQTERVEALEQRIEVCRQQVEHFAAQVTRLTADYTTLASSRRLTCRSGISSSPWSFRFYCLAVRTIPRIETAPVAALLMAAEGGSAGRNPFSSK